LQKCRFEHSFVASVERELSFYYNLPSTWVWMLSGQVLKSSASGDHLITIVSGTIEWPGSNNAWPGILKEFFMLE